MTQARIGDLPVDQSVKRVTGLQSGGMQRFHIIGQQDRPAIGAGVDLRQPAMMKTVLHREIERRRTGGDPVEVLGITLRFHQGLAPAIRAA